MPDFDHIPIEALELSKRTYHALARSGVLTVSDLRDFYLNKGRYHVRNIGDKSLGEILKALEELPNNPSVMAFEKKEYVQLSIHQAKWKEKINHISIDNLNLSAAIRGRLRSKGIKTVEDLINASDETLLSVRLIGPKILVEIRQLLAEFIENFNVSEEDPVVTVDEGPVTTIDAKPVVAIEKKFVTWAEIVEDYFRDEKDIYSYILISRFGFYPKTLEEIAAELGVTRERVRQIQESAVVRYLNHIRYSGAIRLLEKIEEVFSAYGDGLSLSSLKTILKRMECLANFPSLSKQNISEI